MNNSQFENTMLEAEVALLREELAQTNQSLVKEKNTNSIISQKLSKLTNVNTQFVQVSNENKKLVEQMNTKVGISSENHSLRTKVTELDAKLERLKNTPAQQEVEKYRQFYLQEEQERAKYQTGLYTARNRIEKMKYEIEVLNHQLSSPYMQEQRGMWKSYAVFLSFLLGCSLSVIVWLVFFD